MSAAEKETDKSPHQWAISEIHGLQGLSACEIKLSSPYAASSPLHHYAFALTGGTKIDLLAFPARSSLKLSVHLSPGTAPTSKQAREVGAVAAVNGGYFNLSDGESASYVIINGAIVGDPTKNKALTGNVKLQPFLKDIFDRAELRIMEDDRGQTHYAVTTHKMSLPQGLKLVDSLQGGPRLLPELTAEKEAFVRHEPAGETTDSIGVMRTAARTAVGLTDDGQVLVISVAGKKQSEFSAGMDLATLAKLLKNLGASEAINFDGGTSTTMVLKAGLGQTNKSSGDGCFEMLVGREPETMVKSTLCLVESKK